MWCPLIMHLPRKCDIKQSRQQHNLGRTRCVLAFCFPVRFFIAVQNARRQFRAIPCSPPGLEPFSHQLSGHSFTTRTRAGLSPPGLEPFFHHQDSSRSSTTRTRAGLSPPGQILSGVRIHKQNKAQPNGLTLFDQTPGRNNFIVRKKQANRTD